ncbi:MAG: exosortase H [Dissulfurispiraceae bacterium]
MPSEAAMPKRKSTKRNKKQIIRAGLPVPPDTFTLRRSHFKNFGFVAAFILTCVGIYAFIFSLPDRYTGPLNEHTAKALALALKFIGIPVSVAGDTVTVKAFALHIIPECTPLFMLGLFLCFIVFSPASVRQKASGLAIGIPVLYFGNLVRLIAIFMVGQHDRSLFEPVHAFWGQVYAVLLVLLVFILWLKSLDKEIGGAANEIGFAAKEGSKWSFSKKTVIIFLGRFAFIAGCLFLVWMKVHHGYIWLLDQAMLFGFSLFGYHFNPARHTPVYYETFSIVTFTALVLAVRSTPWKNRIKELALGLGFLFLTHLFHRIDNFLMVLFNYAGVQTIDMTLLITGQYLLPVLFLVYSIRSEKQEILPEPRKAKIPGYRIG